MAAPVVPRRESSRWVIDRLTAVEFTWRWDVDVVSPLGEFLVGHGPSCVWRFGLALIKSSSLLGWGESEVAQLHHRAQVCCRLPESGALVSTPEAVVDHDVAAELEDPQPDLDEPSFDHVLGRWRILVSVEGLHPFVLRETKCFLLDLYAPRDSGLPSGWESHSQEQCWSHIIPLSRRPASTGLHTRDPTVQSFGAATVLGASEVMANGALGDRGCIIIHGAHGATSTVLRMTKVDEAMENMHFIECEVLVA